MITLNGILNITKMKKLYDSKYTDRKVTAGQYVAELMCERKAKKEKVKLQEKFWEQKEWKQFFLFQLRLANSLLKQYNETTLIQALMSADLKWCFSLKAEAVAKHLSRFASLPMTEELKAEDSETKESVKLAIRPETKKTLWELL